MIAALGVMALVDTQVAMALGASVQPLTRITDSVRITVTKRTGFEKSCCIKSVRVMVIFCILLSHMVKTIIPSYFIMERRELQA